MFSFPPHRSSLFVPSISPISRREWKRNWHFDIDTEEIETQSTLLRWQKKEKKNQFNCESYFDDDTVTKFGQITILLFHSKVICAFFTKFTSSDNCFPCKCSTTRRISVCETAHNTRAECSVFPFYQLTRLTCFELWTSNRSSVKLFSKLINCPFSFIHKRTHNTTTHGTNTPWQSIIHRYMWPSELEKLNLAMLMLTIETFSILSRHQQQNSLKRNDREKGKAASAAEKNETRKSSAL